MKNRIDAPFSVGTDIVEIGRMRKSIEKESFVRRVFSAREQEYFSLKKDPADSMAANWAAKEAFSKALRTGVREFELTEVECLRDELGAPYLILSGKAEKAAEGFGFSVSLSHDVDYAVAVVMAYRK